MNFPKYIYTQFPRPKKSRKNIAWLFFIALSASLFIIVFKPFGIENNTGIWYFELIILSMGAIFFLSIYLMEFIAPYIFPQLFKKWNLGKAIVWYTWVLAFVGTIMFLYKSYLGGFIDFTWIDYMFVTARVFGIALMASFIVVVIFNYFNKKNISQLSQNESYLIHAPDVDSIRLAIDDILYIASDNNYVDIHLRSQNERKKMIFRSSLTNVENQLVNPLTPIYRCHRRYLVNIKYFEIKNKTIRNTTLKLANYKGEIPVSKKHYKQIIDLLQIRT